jgi:hypothetical protein
MGGELKKFYVIDSRFSRFLLTPTRHLPQHAHNILFKGVDIVFDLG